MILEVQHETRFEYTAPVTETVAEVRMEAASNADQSCRSFALSVSPPAEVFRYQDGLGNSVHHFNVLATHQEVRIRAASVIETHPRPRNLTASRARYPLDVTDADLEVLDFLKMGGPVRPTPLLVPLLEALRPRRNARGGSRVAGVRPHSPAL